MSFVCLANLLKRELLLMRELMHGHGTQATADSHAVPMLLCPTTTIAAWAVLVELAATSRSWNSAENCLPAIDDNIDWISTAESDMTIGKAFGVKWPGSDPNINTPLCGPDSRGHKLLLFVQLNCRCCNSTAQHLFLF